MKRTAGRREREELESLKQDLVNPVKRFLGEVYGDTVGDAKRFYAAQARKTQKKARLVRQRTEEQMASLARRRAEQQKQRKASMKKTAIILALIVLIGIVFVSVTLSARAEEPAIAAREELCLPALRGEGREEPGLGGFLNLPFYD